MTKKLKKTQEHKKPTLGSACDAAKDIVNGQRQDTYGNPEDSFSFISLYWNTWILHRTGFDPQLNAFDVAMLMDLFKTARCCGQAFSRDNYIDKIGYTTIAVDRIIPQLQAKRLECAAATLDATKKRYKTARGPWWRRVLAKIFGARPKRHSPAA